MNRYRNPLFLIIGLAAGISLGLYLGWVIWPTEFTDANPSVLQASYQQEYVQLIADAYAADNQDLSTARRRLNELGGNSDELLLDTITDAILSEADDGEIRRLVRLASDLGLSSPAMTPFLPAESQSNSLNKWVSQHHPKLKLRATKQRTCGADLAPQGRCSLAMRRDESTL